MRVKFTLLPESEKIFSDPPRPKKKKGGEKVGN